MFTYCSLGKKTKISRYLSKVNVFIHTKYSIQNIANMVVNLHYILISRNKNICVLTLLLGPSRTSWWQRWQRRQRWPRSEGPQRFHWSSGPSWAPCEFSKCFVLWTWMGAGILIRTLFCSYTRWMFLYFILVSKIYWWVLITQLPNIHCNFVGKK